MPESRYMCRRYDLTALPVDLFEQMLGEVIKNRRGKVEPRYNIGPSQSAPILRRNADGALEVAETRWGLIPFWARKPKLPYNSFNARAETVERSATYRASFKNRRCLVPATGWYEWQGVVSESSKQPWRMHRRDNQPLAFAGLWDHWSREDQTIESSAIIVTDAVPILRSMQSRMPVILTPERARLWLLAEAHDSDRLKRLLAPYAPPELEAYRVSTRVNNIRNDDPALIEPTQP